MSHRPYRIKCPSKINHGSLFLHKYSSSSNTSTTPSIASVLACPTHHGFAYADRRPARSSTPIDNAQLFGVWYSEHSSFFELTYFSLSLDWAGIVAMGECREHGEFTACQCLDRAMEAERRKRPPHAALRSIGKPVNAEPPTPFGHLSSFSVER